MVKCSTTSSIIQICASQATVYETIRFSSQLIITHSIICLFWWWSRPWSRIRNICQNLQIEGYEYNFAINKQFCRYSVHKNSSWTQVKGYTIYVIHKGKQIIFGYLLLFSFQLNLDIIWKTEVKVQSFRKYVQGVPKWCRFVLWLKSKPLTLEPSSMS